MRIGTSPPGPGKVRFSTRPTGSGSPCATMRAPMFARTCSTLKAVKDGAPGGAIKLKSCFMSSSRGIGVLLWVEVVVEGCVQVAAKERLRRFAAEQPCGPPADLPDLAPALELETVEAQSEQPEPALAAAVDARVGG